MNALKELLQGKPFNHPLHPLLVHFPVGLLVMSLIFDLLTLLFGGGNPLVQGAYWTMLVGTIMAVVAAIPGLVDWADIRADHPGKKIATYHMALNLAAIALYGVNLGLRAGELDEPSVPLLPFILSLLGTGILSVSGYLGGKLVYDEGIGVGRHRRHTPTPRDTIHAPAAKEAGGFVEVGSAERLGEGESLRVEVDGEIVALVKLGGQVYAFQEFCTHRYGPLSEGRLVDRQVECPWHRSCFDVRTGKVTNGPAKVDLKTYEVELKEGRINVKR